MIVDSSRITLKDFFDGLDPELSQKEVLDSPPMGQRLILPHHWIKELGENLKLDWTPKISDQIVFERGKKSYNKREIEEIISAKLQENGEIREFQLTLKSEPLIETATGKDIRFELDHVDADGDKEQFRGMLKIFEGPTLKGSHLMEGRFQMVTQIPCLATIKHVGDEIGASDIVWKKVPLSQINHLIATNQDQVIGFTPAHHPLKAGEFIKKHEIKRPKLITKGNEVSLMISTPSMLLTSKGKALEDGTMGATIRVSNISSQKIILGTVKGSGIVEVSMPVQNMMLSKVDQ